MEIITIGSIILLVCFTSITVAYSNNQFGTFTPRKDKWAIFGSLAYLILPIDILDSKRLPIIGWLDEVASLAVLVQKMSKYITPEMEARADSQLDKWFDSSSVVRPSGPEYVEYEMIEG